MENNCEYIWCTKDSRKCAVLQLSDLLGDNDNLPLSKSQLFIIVKNRVLLFWFCSLFKVYSIKLSYNERWTEGDIKENGCGIIYVSMPEFAITLIPTATESILMVVCPGGRKDKTMIHEINDLLCTRSMVACYHGCYALYAPPTLFSSYLWIVQSMYHILPWLTTVKVIVNYHC
jgi:hypothetical protein